MAPPAPTPRTTAPAAVRPSSTPAPATAKRGPAPAADEMAPGVFDLKGVKDFTPPAPIAEFLDARKSSTVNVRFGNLAQGPLKVATARKGKYRVKKQAIPLAHPAFARVAEAAPGLTPALIVTVKDGKLEGEVGLAAGEKFEALSRHLQKAPEILGLLGFTIGTLPTIVNTIEEGNLHLGLKGVPIKLGAAFSGTFNFEIIDETVAFDGNVAVIVKGLANGTLELKRAADGSITGKVAIALVLPKNFSGSVDVAWDGVAVTGIGKVGYKGEKFSGEITLYLMEKKAAEQLAKTKTAPEGAAPKSEAPAKGGDKKPKHIDYVVFGEGDLTFSFTEWLNGTAHVIADPKGNITVIGKITPQKEFYPFGKDPKEYVKQLFKVEARASYGLPVVGNVFIFANASMDVFAKFGPVKFYNIVIDGTYSTDPTVAKSFSIRGSLNISAGAGARLRAEAGVGVEILSHDIKAGAGINGIAGIKAYAEATPIVGYREKGAEGEDKKGEWFIRGELEIAAQPFLGLSGDLFVELETPWWSPLSDDKWTWPLFGKEYPLGGTMGMLASVDYVFGSGQWPKFDLKPVEFDSEKFTTDMYNDKAKSGSGKEAEQKGKWQEKNSAAAEPPPKTSPPGNVKPGKAPALPPAKAKPAASKKSGKPADPNAKTKEGKSVKQLQDEAAKKGKKPAGPEAKGAKKDAGKKEAGKETHDVELKKGLAALEAVTARYAQDGATKEDLITGMKAVRRKFPVFKSIEVVDGTDTWDYDYVASKGSQKGPKKSKGKQTPPVTHVTWEQESGRAIWVKAEPLTKKRGNTRGSARPTAVPPGWPRAQRVNAALPGTTIQWVRAHLLSYRFHGPGDETWNLVPATQAANSVMTSVEDQISQALEEEEGNKALWFAAHVEYRGGSYRHFPKTIDVAFGEMNNNRRGKRRGGAKVEVPSPTKGLTSVSINEWGREVLEEIGEISERAATYTTYARDAAPGKRLTNANLEGSLRTVGLGEDLIEIIRDRIRSGKLKF